ncbi:MAG: translation initiation factor IF-2 [Candidatus Korobacteraceae bacterium]
MKIRINDLARELEVKSREILEVLLKVGVTEKKTHSSSIEEDEAARVRRYVLEQQGSGREVRHRASPDELRPKIDLSKISKPGDALKAIIEQKEHPHAALRSPASPMRPPELGKPPAIPPRAVVTKAAPRPVEPPAVESARPAPPAVEPTTPKPRFITPSTAARPVFAPPPSKVEPPKAPTPPISAPEQPREEKIDTAVVELEAPPAPPSVASVPLTAPPFEAEPEGVSAEEPVPTEPIEAATLVEQPADNAQPASPAHAATSTKQAGSARSPQTSRPAAADRAQTRHAAGPASPHAPAAGGVHAARSGQLGQQGVVGRRMIVPQTGPRPVYHAPAQPLRPATPPAARPTGLPVRGQPLFQRPRPQPGGAVPAAGAPPGTRPAPRPGERRPMHPTRTTPGQAGRPMGARPMGAATGAPPPTGRPPGRPGSPSRRPGQRYVPRGKQEGPMKGFVPPPRLSLSTEPLPITREITITEGISVKDLAERLGIRAKDMIARLLARGVFATINQTLDAELANEMARQFGASTNLISFEAQVQQDMENQALAANDESVFAQVTRPPVVTIMGHVDHGKTSLLDAIRSTNVAEGEAGGITQHIGAYKVQITDTNSPAYGREIVFLDTPGHEAFTRMRARGSKVTDIVVLVVAADDGVMPQTLEAIDHANAAKVPIIVAVNKIDKPGALPDRVKKQLADRGLLPEDWGGSTVFVDVSAKQKTNLNLLMEMVCLVADMQDLKAVPERSATGSVLEAKLDRGRGPVATVLVQNGTLHAGDHFVVGNVFGKVRAMLDDRGRTLETAPPATPVEILGLEGLPQAGDQFVVVADREKAREIAEYREQKAREASLAKSTRVSLEGLAEQIKTAGVKELPIILKGDVQGSVEVLSDLLAKLSNDQVKIRVLHASVGAITETDVLLASASNAIIIGFNVRPERKAQEMAAQEKVDIRLHSIIYELQDEMKKAMVGLLEPTIKETYLGRAEVRDTFRIPKVGTVAGCFIADGTIKRDSEIRLLRDNVVVFKGKIASLRRVKEDVSEVRNGLECGISIANYNDVKIGDVIEAYLTERIAAEMMA